MKRFETIVESDLLSLYTVNTSDTLRSDDEISVSVSEVSVELVELYYNTGFVRW